jgi:hypothetical protein
MSGGTMTIDAADLDKLNASMAAVQSLCGRSMNAVTFRTAKEMGFQLARFTLLSKKLNVADIVTPVKRGKARIWAWVDPNNKRRDVLRLPVTLASAQKHGLRGKTAFGSENIRAVKGGLPSGPVIGWSPQKYSGKKPKIVGRGYAKSAWFAAMGAAGLPVKGSKQAEAARMFSRGKTEKDAARTAIELVNAIPYIGKMDAGINKNPPGNIMAKAIHATVGTLERDITKLKEKISAGWTNPNATGGAD